MNKELCKVLVVDDVRDNADMTAELLRIWGHEAEVAYSAEDALSKAIAFDPDVVLMDIGMPGMNGFDIADELRKSCPQAKFVALTGYTQADIVRRAREAGFVRVLTKPATAKAVEEAVDIGCAASPSQQA